MFPGRRSAAGRSFGPRNTQESGRAYDFIQRLAGFSGNEASDALVERGRALTGALLMAPSFFRPNS